jgi:transposase InsO family protein
MRGHETLEEVTGRLAEAESRSPELAPTAAQPRAHAAVPEPLGTEARLASLEVQLREITLALRKGTASTPGPQHVERPGRRDRHCYCCGSEYHVARDCPKRCQSHSALPSHHLGGRWLLGSGTSHHMSPGGGAGAVSFTNSKPFQYPLMVHSGMRGAIAPALGMGSLVICGRLGPEVLDDVLHVPELASPLFSVRAALAKGMAVHFSPPGQSGSPDRVEVELRGRVVFIASTQGDLYFLDEQPSAAVAGVTSREVELAQQWHRRLGHQGFSALAGLALKRMLNGCSMSPASFMQASKQQVCQPCVVGKMRRALHPSRSPKLVRVLHRVHVDLCELLPGLYFATVVDEATRYACVGLLNRKSDTAAEIRRQIIWCETQTDSREQRVRHDRGGEYMSWQLHEFYQEQGIQSEPTAGYSPEANGLAERHNLTLLDMALSMLADSGGQRLGLPPLGKQHAGDTVLYANHLHNATPAKGAHVGSTPQAGFLQREDTLSVFHRFGCRVWVHNPGRPHTHRHKLEPRGVPGRFRGIEGPLVSSVLLDDGRVTQSPTVVFDDPPRVPPPVLQPVAPASSGPAAMSGGGEDSESDEDAVALEVPPPATMQPLPKDAAMTPTAAEPPPADDAVAPSAPPPPAEPPGQPVHGKSNANPWYRGDPVIHYPQAQAAWGRQKGERAEDCKGRGDRGEEQHVSGHTRGCFGGRHKRRQRSPRVEAAQTSDPPSQLLPVQPPEAELVEAALPAPRSVREALCRPDRVNWQAAIEAEVGSCIEYGVWEACDLPAGRQVLPSHFVLERKRDGRYKARLVAGGHCQQRGLDFDETFAPVYRSVRMMLAVSAHEGLEPHF